MSSKHGGGDVTYAELNEDQATYLITLFRNTPIVRRFKIALVKAFRRAINELNRIRANHSDSTWNYIRDDTKSTARAMIDAVEARRIAQGKEFEPHHASNEHRMLNGVLTGSVKPRNRDSLSPAELRDISDAQRLNMKMIVQDIPYKERKVILLAERVKKLTQT